MSHSNALTVARAYHRAWSTRDLDNVTVENGRIQPVRQIHDTAALHAAGFGRPS